MLAAIDWPGLWAQGLDLLREHWTKAVLPVLGLLLGWWWGRRRARREWAKKQFVRRVNVSLNLLEDDGHDRPTLRIRTLLEKDAKDVFLNDVAVDRLVAAAARTTKDDPLLPLGDDAWFLLNAVLNEISERYSDGFLRRDVGAPTRSAVYLIGLTFEREGAMRTQKVRAMVVRRDVLRSLLTRRDDETGRPIEPPEPRYEHPNHATRWRTLRQLASAWQADPSRFLEMEIVV